MDRNLGAQSAEVGNCSTTIGMYYQFGRKDPFPGKASMYDIKGNVKNNVIKYVASSISSVFTYIVNNPNIYIWKSAEEYLFSDPYYDQLWDNPTLDLSQDPPTGWHELDGGKSIYDPCPAGWMIPELKFFSSIGKTSNTAGGWNFGYSLHLNGLSGETAWFPASGLTPLSNVNAMGIGSYGELNTSTPNNKRRGYWEYGNGSISSSTNLPSQHGCGYRGVGFQTRCVQQTLDK